ncbi:unnamed protein product [Calypogeia fissa]
MGEMNNEYRLLLEEMLRELDGGCEPDQKAMEGLKTARKMLAHCGNQESRKRKQKCSILEDKLIRVRAATAIWRDVLSKHTLPNMVKEKSFQRYFTMDGKKGYRKFVKEIRDAAFGSLDREEILTPEGKKWLQVDLEKSNGWLDNVVANLSLNVWKYLEEKLTSNQKEILGNPGFYTYKKQLLEGWSKELRVANTKANVNYGNKVVQIGELGIQQSAKHGTRPSHCILDARGAFIFSSLNKSNTPKRLGLGRKEMSALVTCWIVLLSNPT